MARLAGRPRRDGVSGVESGRSPDRGERGQLILIAAFALAVTFVALALVVNSAIFTENLASRGDGRISGDALSMRDTVESELGDVVSEANANVSLGWTDLETRIDRAVINVSTVVGKQEAARGGYVDLTRLSTDEGTRIADVTPGGSTFVGSSDATRWTVASTSATRAFVLHVDRSTVTGGSTTFGDTRADEFEINVTAGGDDWLLNLTERNGDFTVGVREPGGGSGTCVAPGTSGTVTVDLTRGTVAGRDCPALTFAEGLSGTYDVDFNNSDLVAGNYSLVVDADGYTNPELQSGPTAGDPDDPWANAAIYATTVRYRYDDPTVHYAVDVRVAPGETDG